MNNSRAALAIDAQIVLVTGGGRGLGRHLGQSFLREGARVVINYLNSASAANALVPQAPDRAIAGKDDVPDPVDGAEMARAAATGLAGTCAQVVYQSLPTSYFN